MGGSIRQCKKVGGSPLLISFWGMIQETNHNGTNPAPLPSGEGGDGLLLSLFKTFFKIGAFTLGGGYAMIPIIEAEVVQKRKWIDEKLFTDLIAVAQTCPGVFAANISIFIGYKLRKTKGAMVTCLGTCLPSFLIILAIAMFFTAFKDNPWVARAFQGIRPAVIALILVPMVDMARKSCKKWWAWAIAVASLVAVAFLSVSPIYIILCVAVLGFSVTRLREKKGAISTGRRNLTGKEGGA